MRAVWGRGAFPHEFWFILDPPGRGWVENAARHAGRLELTANSCVLEIGSGTGFWSRAVAARVPKGKLHLFDLQTGFLLRARRRIQKAGFSNVTYCAGDARRLAYRDETFDRAYLVTVLGEVPDEAACLAELSRVLKHGGLVAVSERRLDPDFVSRERLAEMANAAGFTLRNTYGTAWAYTTVLTKP